MLQIYLGGGVDELRLITIILKENLDIGFVTKDFCLKYLKTWYFSI